MYFLAVRTESEDIVVKRVVRKLERYFANVQKIQSKLQQKIDAEALAKASTIIQKPLSIPPAQNSSDTEIGPRTAFPVREILLQPPTVLPDQGDALPTIIEIQKSAPIVNPTAVEQKPKNLKPWPVPSPAKPAERESISVTDIDLTAQQQPTKKQDIKTTERQPEIPVREKINTPPKPLDTNIPRRKNFVANNRMPAQGLLSRQKEAPQDSQIPQMREDVREQGGLILGVRTGALVAILLVLMAAMALAIFKNQKFIY